MQADALDWSAEDRVLLCDSLRELLARGWTPSPATTAAAPLDAVSRIWARLADHGVLELCASSRQGGWREAVLAIGELGRAACPAPLIDAALCQHLAAATKHDVAPRATEFAAAVAAGTILPALVFGNRGGDLDAGRAALDADDRVIGDCGFVEHAGWATHYLVAVGDRQGSAEDAPEVERLAIVSATAPAVRVEWLPGLAATPLARLHFSRAPAIVLSVAPGTTASLAALARLGLAARALGAARRAFELVVDHAKTRTQFGQPIGHFQAIQHKLADGLIALEAAALLRDDAARRVDSRDPQWRCAIEVLVAFAAPALSELELQIHHAFGAIGFAEEHEAPRHFRQVFGDVTRLGGARAARDALATRLLSGSGSALPELDVGDRANAFRTEVRAWLGLHWDAAARTRERARPFCERGVDREFSRTLGLQRWIAVSWPREYGGLGLGPLEQFVFMEEMALAGAPLGAHSCASEMIGPALIAFGSDEQKARFLPAFLQGALTFSLGYSESGAGSDLASLRFRAVRDGEGWLLDGEKLWTSRGDVAHYHWLAARTDAAATPPHAGISVFMVPLDSPGITIRTGSALHGHTFSSVHYDRVRVPDSARVGDVNGGWKVITQALASERIVMGAQVATILGLFESLVQHVATAAQGGRALREDPLLRDRLGAFAAQICAARQLAVDGVRLVARGGLPLHQAAMSKVYSAELLQRLTLAALDLLGSVATLGEDASLAILDGRIEQQLRRSIMMVVGGGTAEIQRNLIATRGLGLPR